MNDTTPRKPMTLHRLRDLHAKGEAIAMLTCYDASFARVLDAAGVDCVLVGDSPRFTAFSLSRKPVIPRPFARPCQPDAFRVTRVNTRLSISSIFVDTLDGNPVKGELCPLR